MLIFGIIPILLILTLYIYLIKNFYSSKLYLTYAIIGVILTVPAYFYYALMVAWTGISIDTLGFYTAQALVYSLACYLVIVGFSYIVIKYVGYSPYLLYKEYRFALYSVLLNGGTLLLVLWMLALYILTGAWISSAH